MSKKIKIHRYVKNKEVVFASVLVGVISIVRIKVNIMFKLQLVDGEVMGKEYEYTLMSFDKEGKEKELEFTAQKSLHKEAFLFVYHSDKKDVAA